MTSLYKLFESDFQKYILFATTPWYTEWNRNHIQEHWYRVIETKSIELTDISLKESSCKAMTIGYSNADIKSEWFQPSAGRPGIRGQSWCYCAWDKKLFLPLTFRCLQTTNKPHTRFFRVLRRILIIFCKNSWIFLKILKKIHKFPKNQNFSNK